MLNRTIDWLRQLVAIDTVSANSNLPLLHLVQQQLEQLGLSSELVLNKTGDKANLYCTIGPHDRGGLMLSGHTDVVPVAGQRWSSDPFHLVRRDDRLFGRGAADMKGWIAGVLARLPDMVKQELKTPIHIALSYDEEVGCLGVRSLVDILARATTRPALCVVGEPSEMKVIVAHKGKQYIRVHIRGVEGHSSLSPFGVNAIEYAADLITFLRDLGDNKARHGPFDRDFDVPFTTVMTGIVHGGTNLNIVPNYCYFDFEVREIPGDDAIALIDECKSFANQIVLPRMRAVSEQVSIDFEEVSLRPNLNTPLNEPIVTLAKEWSGQQDHYKVAFGTEAALFQRTAGIPSVVCGPGSIQQAHKPDEYVEIAQLGRFDEFLQRLIRWAAGEQLHEHKFSAPLTA